MKLWGCYEVKKTLNRQHILVLLNWLYTTTTAAAASGSFIRVISLNQSRLTESLNHSEWLLIYSKLFYSSCTTPNKFLQIKVVVVLGGTAKSGLFA